MYYSAKRENPGNDFQRDLLEKSKKREELGTDLIEYIEYITDGSAAFLEVGCTYLPFIHLLINPFAASGKREELGTNLIEYIDYITDGSSSISGGRIHLSVICSFTDQPFYSKRKA